MYYFLLILFTFGFSDIKSEGDLALRSKKIELQLGSKVSDYEMSKKVINLETGKAYRLEISSLGFKEYEFEAEEFFKNIWIRKIEIDGIEIVTSTLLEIEFEREGEIE